MKKLGKLRPDRPTKPASGFLKEILDKKPEFVSSAERRRYEMSLKKKLEQQRGN